MFLGFLVIFATMFSLDAHAGFRAFNGSTDLKLVQGLRCSSGMNCSVGKDAILTVNAAPAITAPSGSSTLGADSCGKVMMSSGAAELTLPVASTVIGCQMTFVVGASGSFGPRANVADKILPTATDPGHAVKSTVVGGALVIVATKSGQWNIISQLQSWSDPGS